MWSDPPEPATLRHLAQRLSQLDVGAPARTGTRRQRVDLGAGPPMDAVAERLHAEPGFAWLEGPAWGGELFVQPRAVIRQRAGTAILECGERRERLTARGWDLLDAALHCWGGLEGASLVGYLGYELGCELEALPQGPPDDVGTDDLYLALYDAALRPSADGRWQLHHAEGWSSPTAGGRAADRWQRWLSEASRRPPAPDREGPLTDGAVRSRPDGTAYRAAVARTVARIHAGEIFQTNLCRRLEAPLATDGAWRLFRRLRRDNPASYSAYLRLGTEAALLSASPECFLRFRGRRVESRPIKGTRPRGASPNEDRRLAAELTASEKDRAELAMIVDLVRNDLGRVCVAGSVQVESHAELYSLPTVHHTVSTVSGRLPPTITSADVLRAAFPPGSITGAPKIQAMAVATREEPCRRGPAMGAVARFRLGGDADLSVAIRTATAVGERVVYHAGAGIVADSEPALELEETRAKARAFLDALGAAELDD